MKTEVARGSVQAMSDFLTSLQEPEYVHVLLNHLPMTGLLAALLSLAVGIVVRKRPILFVGLALVSLFSLAAWPVSEYGEAGYDRVLAMSDDEGQAYLKRHRDLADNWVFLFYVAAGAGALAMGAGWKWPRSLWGASLGVALLGASSLVAGTIIAECGGKIRHREFRHGSPPSATNQAGGRILRIPFSPQCTELAFSPGPPTPSLQR